ncbi:SDR family NAD(P)-dependent oxidoreductase [Dyella solisilvae]|uniref:SDR family NAD(P)-dependent oxidoreductase n=1 Tax=Dyella solisilvae TaxID=1920168 RepID=A0A370K2J8_9GAMM|nr:SDR family oxidoreductase [Dyella solisilvae]RDI96818.1 SDR family NAD(P)-dependent oxidoreductase [Dyella solisilvae]
MIAVTGANGQLGRLVINQLLEQVSPDQVVAAVRDPENATDLRALGVELRQADYDDPASLRKAFEGVEKVLLISSTVPGQRLRQHKAVIDAARDAGVKLIAYTSMLRADSSRSVLAAEHLATENYLVASGVDHVLLRNGWYIENHTAALPMAAEHGALMASSGSGRFASAARADYAAAAVAVLTQAGHANKTYELAGDTAFTLDDLATAVSARLNREIAYRDLSPTEYEAALLGMGLPQMIVDVIIDADAVALKGDLDSSSRELSTLIGRPTTTLAEAVRSALPA